MQPGEVTHHREAEPAAPALAARVWQPHPFAIGHRDARPLVLDHQQHLGAIVIDDHPQALSLRTMSDRVVEQVHQDPAHRIGVDVRDVLAEQVHLHLDPATDEQRLERIEHLVDQSTEPVGTRVQGLLGARHPGGGQDVLDQVAESAGLPGDRLERRATGRRFGDPLQHQRFRVEVDVRERGAQLVRHRMGELLAHP